MRRGNTMRFVFPIELDGLISFTGNTIGPNFGETWPGPFWDFGLISCDVIRWKFDKMLWGG